MDWRPGTTEARTAERAPDSVEVVAVTWERIQVTFRARLPAGTTVDPARVLVRRRERPDINVAPARVEQKGDELTIRVNVMQGPNRAPLWPGNWILTVGGDRPSRWREVTVAPTLDLSAEGVAVDTARQTPTAASRTFELRGHDFVVRPQAEGEDRALVIRIALVRVRNRHAASDPDFRNGGEDSAGADEAVRVHRRYRVLRRWLGALRGVGFAIAFNGFRLVARRNGRRILFTSDSRGELGGNLKLVHDRLVERGLDADYELMHLFKPGITASRSFRDRFRLPWLLARADTVLVDDYQPAIYKVTDRSIRIIQLWHAYGAFKTVGYSRVGRPGGPDPWSRVHKNYTYAVVGSHNDVPFYAEAFGIREDQVRATGLPRMDVFIDSIRDGGSRETLLQEFPEARGRRVILYAPTFRGNGAKGAYFDESQMDWPAIHAACVAKDAVFIVRLHPFVPLPPAIPDGCRDRIIDGTGRGDPNELLPGVDVLITDYSSIVYEYSLLRRPMLFYAYDLDDYIASRDFYVRYEDFVPGRIVRSAAELVDAIRRDDFGAERVDAFVRDHFDHFDGRSTDRIIDQLILPR